MIRDPNATIYQDMDGCLSDFDTMARRVLGHDWDAHRLGHLQESEQGLILNQHKGFWKDMPPMPDFHLLWEYIHKYDPHILTAVPHWDHQFDEVEEGKWAWVKQHIPSLPRSRFHCVYREDKRKYARHGNSRNILIDDYFKNVKEFESQGGIGIPHHNAKVTIVQLKALEYD